MSRLRFCFEGLTAESNHSPYNPGTAPWRFIAADPERQQAIDAAVAEVAPAPERYAGQFLRLHRALTEGGPLPVSIADARPSLELLTAAYHSARTGAAVQLPHRPRPSALCRLACRRRPGRLRDGEPRTPRRREALRRRRDHPRRRPQHRGRRVRRLRRPVRLREVDAAADDRRAGGDHRRRGLHRRRAGERRSPPPSAALPWCSSPTRSIRTCRCARTSPSAWRRWARPSRRSRRRVADAAEILQDRRVCSTAGRDSFPAASASASPSAAPSCASRGSSSSTSRSPTSTRSCACRCGWRSTSCTAASARP